MALHLIELGRICKVGGNCQLARLPILVWGQANRPLGRTLKRTEIPGTKRIARLAASSSTSPPAKLDVGGMADSNTSDLSTEKSFITRRALEEDYEPAAQILQDALGDFLASIGQPNSFPPREEFDAVKTILTFKGQHPKAIDFVAVAVDARGKELEVIGSNAIDVRDSVGGIGVLSVSTKNNGQGVGRALMRVVMETYEKQGGKVMSLMVNAANLKAFSLYASLGFHVVEFCTVVEGLVSDEEEAAILDRAEAQGLMVREMKAADVPLCDRLFTKFSGFSRINGLRDAQAGRDGFQGEPALVVARLGASGGDEIAGYATSLSHRGHYLAENEGAVQAMVAYGSRMLKSTSASDKVSLRAVPRLNHSLLTWAMKAGLRVKSHWLWMYKGEPFELAKELTYCPDLYF